MAAFLFLLQFFSDKSSTIRNASLSIKSIGILKFNNIYVSLYMHMCSYILIISLISEGKWNKPGQKHPIIETNPFNSVFCLSA